MRNDALAILKEAGLVAVDIYNQKIKLTDRGKIALISAKKIVPEDVEYKVFMDGFTGEVYMDTLKKYQKKNLEIIPCCL